MKLGAVTGRLILGPGLELVAGTTTGGWHLELRAGTEGWDMEQGNQIWNWGLVLRAFIWNWWLAYGTEDWY